MWQSAETTPAGDPYLTVKKARDYYYYAERGGVDSVFFILYDSKAKYGKDCGLITEDKPPLDENQDKLAMLTTAFGGSIDMEATKIEIVQTEVAEEAGYEVPINNIHYIGKTMVSTQMNQMAYGYLVDVTDIPKTLKTEHETSISISSYLNKTVWMAPDEVVENEDWKSIFILAQSAFKGLVQ